MGCSYTFHCPSCDYEATVSGGPDMGMSILTQTIHCKTCQEIGDVVTQEFEFQQWPEEPLDPEAPPPDCPADALHEVVKWSKGGPCPKCGTPMAQGEELVRWD